MSILLEDDCFIDDEDDDDDFWARSDFKDSRIALLVSVVLLVVKVVVVPQPSSSSSPSVLSSPLLSFGVAWRNRTLSCEHVRPPATIRIGKEDPGTREALVDKEDGGVQA